MAGESSKATRAVVVGRTMLPLSLAGEAARQVVERYLEQMEWFLDMPWGLLIMVSGAYWIGVDVVNPDGGMRQLFKRLSSFGDFSNFKCRPESFNLGDDYGGEQKFFKVFLTFEFHKKIKVDAIRIQATSYKYMASKIIKQLKNHEWTQEGGQYFKKSELEIPIAYIPEKHGNPGVYGDKKVGGDSLADGRAHYIDIELHAGSKIQRKSIQIFMPHRNVSFDPPDDVNSNRFIIFQDGKLPLPDS